MFDDEEQDSIDERRHNARTHMQNQQIADEIKSRMCDDLRREKMAIRELESKISALECTDPELYAYIRRLELIPASMWCDKCGGVKSVHTEGHATAELHEQEILDHVNKTVRHLQTKQKRMQTDIDKLRQESELIGSQIAELVNAIQPTSVHGKVPKPITKSELPKKPNYTLDASVQTLSADDLLSNI